MTLATLATGTLTAEQGFRRLLIGSLIAHLLLGLVLWITPPALRRPLPPSLVYVEVLPEAGGRAAAPAPPAPARQIVDEPVVIPAKPKPEVKPEPKPEVEPEAKPEPKPEARPQQAYESVMAKLRSKAAERPEAQAGAAGATGGGGILAGILNRERAAYDRKIRAVLYSNWAGVSAFAGRGDLVARFEVTVSRRGDVQDVRLTHPSGNRFLDQSAERAIRRSDPFPPPPPGYTQLAIRFDPAERL